MSEWISLDELLKRWKIIKKDKSLDFIDEFSDFLKEGLQPYSKFGKPIYCPEKVHKDFVNEELIEELEDQIGHMYWDDLDPRAAEADRKLKYQIKKLREEIEAIDQDDSDHTSWKYLSLPRHHELGCLYKRDLVFQTIRYSSFKKDNVTEIESKLPILTVPEEIQTSSSSQPEELPDQKRYISKAGDIVLDKHIVLQKENADHYLLFHREQNSYKYRESIPPQSYNIICFLDKVSKTDNFSFSLGNLESRGLANNKRTISTRINEIMKLCEKYNVKKIFHKFPEDKWGLNQNLDKFNM